MAYSFNSDPPLPASLVGTAVEDELDRRRRLEMVRAAVAKAPAQESRKQQISQGDALKDMLAKVKSGAKDFDKGVAAAVAITDGAKAEDEMATVMQPVAVVANAEPARAAPPVKDNATAPVSMPQGDFTPKRATSMFEAIQEMDPLGQAFMASALGVPAEVFKSPEEMEIQKRSTQAVLKWRVAMDDPNSPERKALDAGDLPGFAKMAMAAGAMDPLSGSNLLAELRSEDEKRASFGFDPRDYDQALVPIMAKSATLKDATLANTIGDDIANVDPQDQRVMGFDLFKTLSTPGAVEDVSRATSTAAAEDILGKRDMRPYVMAANMAFFDQITTGLSHNLEYDPVTGVAKIPQLNKSFLGLGGDEPIEALRENLGAYLRHQRVSLVASRRFSPEAVAAMDDMQVLSIATGKPRMAAVVDDDGEPIIGDIKTVLQQQSLFAPNGYDALAGQVLGGEFGGEPSGGEKPKAKGAKKKEKRGFFLKIPGAEMMSEDDEVGG